MPNLHPEPDESGPERLLAAAEAPLSAEAQDRVWAKVRAELEAAPRQPRVGDRPFSRPPVQRGFADYWIAGLAVAAAAALFALLLGLPGVSRAPAPRRAVVEEEKPKAEEVSPAQWIERLKAEDFSARRMAFLALLRGGEKARVALQAFKPGGDLEQEHAIRELLRGHEMLGRLAAHPDADSLRFWQGLWEMEAQAQPDIWTVALKFEETTPLPATPPTGLLADVLMARFGDEKGAALKQRFAQAFQALKVFQHWERTGFIDEGKEDEHARQQAAQDQRLKLIEAAGLAVAPVVLHILEQPVSDLIRSAGHPPGDFSPYPLDHLRMIVAAERLKLQEALPILMEKFVPGYFMSMTIRANAIAAVWRIGVGPRKCPGFPLEMPSYLEESEENAIAAVTAWWCERQVGECVPRLGNEDFSVRNEAEKNLLALGAQALPFLEKFAPVTDAEARMRLARIVASLQLGSDFAAVETQEQALSLRTKYLTAVLKDLESNVEFRISMALYEHAMELVVKFAPAERKNLFLADLYYEAGMKGYRLYKGNAGAKNQPNPCLTFALKELNKAVDAYSAQLALDPQNKDLEDRVTEANMIQYAIRKYQTTLDK